MGYKELIENFYTSFNQLDSAGMIECYHEDIEFTDPAFGTLHGQDVRDMWTMLCGRAKEFSVEYSDITIHDNRGFAHWEAHYIFGAKKRKVHNVIDASFEFEDGKIIKHVDVFDVHRWAKQAMGLPGLILGGTAFFQKKVNKNSRALLASYQAKKAK